MLDVTLRCSGENNQGNQNRGKARRRQPGKAWMKGCGKTQCQLWRADQPTHPSSGPTPWTPFCLQLTRCIKTGGIHRFGGGKSCRSVEANNRELKVTDNNHRPVQCLAEGGSLGAQPRRASLFGRLAIGAESDNREGCATAVNRLQEELSSVCPFGGTQILMDGDGRVLLRNAGRRRRKSWSGRDGKGNRRSRHRQDRMGKADGWRAEGQGGSGARPTIQQGLEAQGHWQAIAAGWQRFRGASPTGR
ncbi:hypothetical protein B0T16DRAFT_197392 [Cercophora newfieldiana]|uniref:Uncharacterized protein n=1 Tax=Cercophora newfieldiana TaxID=92897 RepID=A0AA39Y3M0_9PEZI|nr:hypothetical protein B0T16DRAFT_197392 [Cercophora newfieldiana]